MTKPDLSLLDEDQLRAATAPRGPVCILAGAGTGKTRTITYRIANLVDQGFVSPQRVLAVTFTARAAGEMRDRLRTMGVAGVQAQTFHAAARRQLKYFWPQVAGDLPWQLLDNKFPLVARAVRSVGLDNSKDMIRDVLAEIEWAKSALVSAEDYESVIATTDRSAPADPAKVAEAFRRYEQSKATPDMMHLDFDDLLMHIAGAIENVPAIAETFREQYRTFVVDEYQDVTPLQQRVLNAWLGERDDLTVVGDANQTIYSFNGASPDYLLNFSRNIHGPHCSWRRRPRGLWRWDVPVDSCWQEQPTRGEPMFIGDIALSDYRVLQRGDTVNLVMFVQGQFFGVQRVVVKKKTTAKLTVGVPDSDAPRDNRTYRLDAGYANCADEVDAPWHRPEDVLLVPPGEQLDSWLAEHAPGK